MIHYLDDFLVVIPDGNSGEKYRRIFNDLCSDTGFSIKEPKNEEGPVASFAGFELDTQVMVIQLPAKKLMKASHIIQNAKTLRYLSLLELQQITEYLNFITTVILLGRTSLHRLYNMELYYPPGIWYTKRRVSPEAQKDLDWWANTLSHVPARSMALKTLDVIYAWSDAASTKGLGAFYTSLMQPTPTYNSAFSIRENLSYTMKSE